MRQEGLRQLFQFHHLWLFECQCFLASVSSAVKFTRQPVSTKRIPMLSNRLAGPWSCIIKFHFKVHGKPSIKLDHYVPFAIFSIITWEGKRVRNVWKQILLNNFLTVPKLIKLNCKLRHPREDIHYVWDRCLCTLHIIEFSNNTISKRATIQVNWI